MEDDEIESNDQAPICEACNLDMELHGTVYECPNCNNWKYSSS